MAASISCSVQRAKSRACDGSLLTSNSRLTELVQQHGQVGDARLLVLVSLLIADELSDAYDEIKRLKAGVDNGAREGERQAVEAMDRMAERLEQLAAALQTA